MRNLLACAILFGITCCSPELDAMEKSRCESALTEKQKSETLNRIAELNDLIGPERPARSSQKYPTRRKEARRPRDGILLLTI
ncbi:hypothetical protein FACS189472_12560 [Alphaproteobacteria bacterium]|nr:hypothetical protein FACS189472_12560 [Alphaproteobacteria bacterium]